MSASVRYMGSKRALAAKIARKISAQHPRSTILDVFAGTCAVASELAPKHRIYTNDIHAFAEVIAKALFVVPPKVIDLTTVQPDLGVAYNKNFNALKSIFDDDLLEEEKILKAAAKRGHWQLFVETNNDALKQAIPVRDRRLALSRYKKDKFQFPYSLATLYFSHSYFGLRQAVEIDSIRYAIDQGPREHRAAYLYALLQAVSHCGATPGHFAQYLIPRNFTTSKYISGIRRRSVLGRFLDAVRNLPSTTCLNRFENRTFRADATSLLMSRNAEFGNLDLVIYADPPYSRAQYSRYYHVLETLVLYDYPVCESKGRYRGGRFQTDFSRQAQVVFAMDQFIAAAADTGASLYMSYPSNGLLSKEGITLRELMQAHYKRVRRVANEPLNHSTLGGASGSAAVSAVEEVYYGGW